VQRSFFKQEKKASAFHIASQDIFSRIYNKYLAKCPTDSLRLRVRQSLDDKMIFIISEVPEKIELKKAMKKCKL